MRAGFCLFFIISMTTSASPYFNDTPGRVIVGTTLLGFLYSTNAGLTIMSTYGLSFTGTTISILEDQKIQNEIVQDIDRYTSEGIASPKLKMALENLKQKIPEFSEEDLLVQLRQDIGT